MWGLKKNSSDTDPYEITALITSVIGHQLNVETSIIRVLHYGKQQAYKSLEAYNYYTKYYVIKVDAIAVLYVFY